MQCLLTGQQQTANNVVGLDNNAIARPPCGRLSRLSACPSFETSLGTDDAVGMLDDR